MRKSGSTKGVESMDVRNNVDRKPFGKEAIIVKTGNGKKIMIDIDAGRGEAS